MWEALGPPGVGEPWPAPLVRDATGALVTTLNPIKPNTSNEENTATLTVTDTRLRAGNVLAGLWTVAGAQASYVPWVTVATDGQVQAPVPREFIAAAVGKQVVVEYVVFRDVGGEVIGTSLAMTLTVLAIAEDALPRPDIMEAGGGADVLDVSRLTADATATVAAWPFIDTSQVYWLEAQGTLPDGTSTVITMADRVEVPSLNGVAQSIPLARLQGLKDGSSLKVVMSVSMAPTVNEVVQFPVEDLTAITAGQRVRVEDFGGWPEAKFPSVIVC